MTRPEATRPASSGMERATIGRSITIKGEVRGDEDLLIQGQVDGSVDLKQHAVTVGGEGRVKANITARVVTVEGQVEGDLKAKEQVILRSSARVLGDLTAPRVILEDGASFRGLVDMGEGSVGPAGAGQANKEHAGGSPGRDSASQGTASGTSGDSGKPSGEADKSSGGATKVSSGSDKAKS